MTPLRLLFVKKPNSLVASSALIEALHIVYASDATAQLFVERKDLPELRLKAPSLKAALLPLESADVRT